ncbi:hypothetical protein AKJ53_00910 [candidate division MSBL1 archaeon SCGC-AAA382F02]|uniref:Sulfatase N-terminal domain-containing protein n=1 Tax=candidate division MSBL1 archaeon SCGC-AAA382F02 TaxID=1698282 RepID=A0A133VIK4_9EURY|nr:hypothetical protein AKJ53_00910 [candidate division MSBL1 archaeon SCGC-AAA382F02]
MSLKSQKRLIHERDWHVLIVLDACRYDYFEEIYQEYLSGKLRKVRSQCFDDSFLYSEGRTKTWLRNTFDKKMGGVVYVSGTPHVNSVEVNTENEDFVATDVFSDIIDVWDWGWAEELGTTPPEKIVEGVNIAKEKYSEKDLIIHFVQPHGPYLALGGKEIEVSGMVSSSSELGILDRGRKMAGRILQSFLPGEIFKELRNFFSSIDKPAEKIAKEYGKGELRNFYTKNLRSALVEVEKIVRLFPDKSIVITSDHGEFLGEKGLYGHNWNEEFLTEVPWFEVS